MTGLRVPYAMALEDEIPFSKTFATLSKTTNAPYAAAFTIRDRVYHDAFRHL